MHLQTRAFAAMENLQMPTLSLSFRFLNHGIGLLGLPISRWFLLLCFKQNWSLPPSRAKKARFLFAWARSKNANDFGCACGPRKEYVSLLVYFQSTLFRIPMPDEIRKTKCEKSLRGRGPRIQKNNRRMNDDGSPYVILGTGQNTT